MLKMALTTISMRNLSLAILLAFTASVAQGADYPHQPSNPILPDIGCLSCHDLQGSLGGLLKASAPNPDMGGDNTEANNLCWSCHTGPALAPYRVPHSSDQVGVQHGTWNMECKDCHNPHNQPQIQAYGSAAYLATGTLTSVISGTTSILTDASATWVVDEHAGRIVFPDINARNRRGRPIGNLSYRVLSNTATALTVDGEVNVSYIAAGDTYGIIYGKNIRDQIKVPGTSTWKQVKFFSQTGANSFADSDATLDGICQVCHTKTAHFRNDGTGIDQLHMNGDRGDPTGTAGENCTDKCHQHIGGFGHGKGYTKVDLCIECHGHEEGAIYDPDGTYPYFPNGSTKTSRGFGSVIPHTTHTESWTTNGATWETTKPASAGDDDLRGPGIYCNSCHDIDNMPAFRKDGAYADDDTNADGIVSLAETSVCDGCHSPGGDYNGVDSEDGSVGAKDNWHSEGIYDADYNFKPGKEKWCAGCHDNDPSRIVLPDRGIDVTAPKVVGDETEDFTYGTGWGFYKTGHGTPSTTTLPATGGIKPGPDKSCTYCHQSIKLHIDGDSRTFDCSDGCDSNEYGTGYRMRFFAGSAPLKMPRDGAGVQTTDFLLCLRSGCHGDITTAFTDPAATNSNFYDAGAGGSLHYLHLNHNLNLIKADWGTTFNSRLTCIGCHNPHGTKNHSMIRTGELVGNSPIRLWFWNTAFGPLPNPPDTPNPSNVTLAASNESILISNSVDEYCAGQCHGAGNWREISRTPYQATDQQPLLNWAGISGFENDGATPDAAPAGTAFKFQVEYRDYDNDPPTSIYLWLDANDNGTYEDPAEKHALQPVAVESAPYVLGVDYTTSVTLNKAGDNIIKYSFTAADADGAASGAPTLDSTLQIQNIAPTLAWTAESGNYSSDGVHPDNGGNGGNYSFRIKYIDDDGDSCPASGSASIQLWIDTNDNGYEAGEKFNMIEVDAGDVDCTTAGGGKLYYYNTTLTTAGPHNYRFHASDGTNDATGAPATSDSTVTVAADANTVPVLEWVTESCRTGGVTPPRGASSSTFEFRVKYTDEDGQCAAGGAAGDIQVWVDRNHNSTYDPSEKINLTAVDGGDLDCTTAGGGKLYSSGAVPITTPNTGITYEFHATDGIAADNAVGEPVTTGGTVDVYSAMTVKASGGDYTSVQAAIAALEGNTTLLVDPGTYGAVSFSYADDNWSILSTCGADLTHISAGGSGDALFTADSIGSTFDGFSFTGGGGRGVVTNGGNITIKNSKIHGNAGYGAQLQTTVTLLDSEIYNNSGGGITTNGGSYTFTNLTIRNNTATTAGAGIFWQNLTAPATLTNVTLKDNSTSAAGGAMYSNGSTVNINGCTITGNTAGTDAGAWALGTSSSHGTLTNCVVAGNVATGKGGAFTTNGGTLSIVNSTLADNVANGGDGGLLWNQNGSTTLFNSIIWNNSASGTGHVAYSNGGAVSLADTVIQNDGDGILNDAPYLYSTNITFGLTGYRSDNDPNFMDAAAGDYHLQAPSDAIDNAGAGAPANDRDGNLRSDPDVGAYEFMASGTAGGTPTLAWTGEAGFTSDGVNPDDAVGGSLFEFRVDYTDAEGVAPAIIELWIDEDGDSAFEASEKYAMTAVGGGGQYGDGIYTNGERYTKSLTLTRPGGGHLDYRIVASDGLYTASGAPALINTVAVGNRAPSLAWPGDANYVSDGVHPDSGDSGASYTFRILYTDPDNTAPAIAQVWIDENDTMFYDSGEYNNMTVEPPDATQYRDGDYSNGEYFTFTKPVYKAGDGRLYYRFAFSDGVDDATGDPASLQLAKERYSRYFTVQEFKTVAGAVSIAAASSTTADISMAYTGDGDGDNTLKVEYGVKPADTYGWTTFATAASPGSPYEPTITGLISGETYDIRTTFIDPDGVLGTAVYTEGLTLPVYATTPLTATAVAGSDPSINISMPYIHDGNGNNTYTIKYRINSPQGAWIDWGTNPKAHTDSPYTDTITGLASAESYDVQVTYSDADGINGSSATQTIMNITMPTVYTVCPSGCDATTIQAAIDAAAAGDMVEVKASGSPYSENIVFDADDDGVYVKSDSGFGSVTIQGLTTGTNLPVVRFTAAVTPAPTLDGFTIDNQTHGGTMSNGIFIENGASPTIRNSVITGNQTDQYNANIGGGIHIAQGGATIEDSRIGSTTAGGGNYAEYGAGIYALTAAGGPYNLTITNSTISHNTINNGNAGAGINLTNFNGTVDITNSTVANNSTSNLGGGIYLTGTTAAVTLTNVTIRDNSSSGADGGGIYTRSPISIEDSTISGNIVPSNKSGAGIFLSGSAAALEMDGSTVTGHSGSSGVGIYMIGSTTATPLLISNSTISSNTASANGGAIYLVSLTNPAILDNVTISNNSAQYGGGIFNNGTQLTITDSVIQNNSASQNSGGMHIQGATAVVDITGSTISSNSARSAAGLRIQTGGTLSLTDSTISGNTAVDGVGAGIYNSASTLNLTRSYLTGNQAASLGGGLYNRYAGSLATLTNTIVSGNVGGDTSSENGGGIYNHSDGALNLYSSTIAGNYAEGRGGGLYTAAVTGVAIENTIIYGNGAGSANPDLYGALTSTEVTYSNIGGWTGGGATNPTPVDPEFVAVDQATSGTPKTGGDYRLKGTSTLIDIGGGANVPADDIEGQYRPVDGDGDTSVVVDIGADEYLDASDSTTAGLATASAASTTSIDVKMPYTNDSNLNNTYTVDYKLSSEPTIWTNWVTDAARIPSIYSTTITGLTEGETYDLRMTYNDINGVTGTNPQTISGIMLPGVGKAVLHPSGTAPGDNVTYYGGTAATALDSNDGDSSYGRSTGSSYDYYLEMDDAGTIGAINSVQIFVVARRDGYRGTANFDIDLISGNTTDSDNAYHAVSSSSYQTFAGKIYNTDPNTGDAWTADAVNNLKVRIDHRDRTDMRVSEVYVVINDTPATPVDTNIHPSGAGAGDAITYVGGTAGTAMDSNDGSTSYGWYDNTTTDSYSEMDDPSPAGDIYSVTVKAVGRREDFSSAAFRLGLKSYGTEYYSGPLSYTSTSYVTKAGTTYTTNPGTGLEWTWSEINDLVAIVDHTDTDDMRVTELYITINHKQEEILPAQITDLSLSNITDSSVLLAWTAPGDDGNTGTASSYDIRYSTTPIVTATWGAATAVTGEPAPLVAGSNQSFTVTGLNPETMYYFGIRTSDEVPNVSGLSNVPSATTTAAPAVMKVHPSGANASDSISSYTGGTAATVYDSNDGNSSYGTSISTGYDYHLEMDNPAASGTIQSVQVKALVRSSSGGTINFDIDLKSGATTVSDNANHTTSSTSYLPFSGALYTTDPNTGAAWTWSAINDLVAIIDHLDVTDMRVTELYLEIKYFP